MHRFTDSGFADSGTHLENCGLKNSTHRLVVLIAHATLTAPPRPAPLACSTTRPPNLCRWRCTLPVLAGTVLHAPRHAMWLGAALGAWCRPDAGVRDSLLPASVSLITARGPSHRQPGGAGRGRVAGLVTSGSARDSAVVSSWRVTSRYGRRPAWEVRDAGSMTPVHTLRGRHLCREGGVGGDTGEGRKPKGLSTQFNLCIHDS